MHKFLLFISFIGISLTLFLYSASSAYSESNAYSASSAYSADFQVSAEPIKIPISQDTYAKEQYWYGRPYRSREIFLGFDTSIKHKRTRPYLNYSISPLVTKGISADQIEKATLMMYSWRNLSSIPYDINIFPVIETWDDSIIDWSHQASVADWHINEVIKVENGWKELDITDIVKDQIKGLIPANGIAIHKDLEYDTGSYFCSINAITESNPDKCNEETVPHILITLKKDIIEPVIIPPVLSLIKIEKNSVTLDIYTKELNITNLEIQQSPDATFETAVSTRITDSIVTYSDLSIGKLFYRVRIIKEHGDSKWSNVIEVEILEPKKDDINTPSKPIQKPDQQDDLQPTKSISIQIKEKPKIIETNPVEISQKSQMEVLGLKISDESLRNDGISHCGFQYNYTNQEVNMKWCSLPAPLIVNTKLQDLGNGKYRLVSKIEQPERILTVVQYNKCKEKSFWDVKTWFACKEEKVNIKEYSQLMNYKFMARIDGRTYTLSKEKGKLDDEFVLTLETNKDLSGKKYQIFAISTFSMKLDEHDNWLDFKRPTPMSIEKQLPKSEKMVLVDDSKPFASTFKSPVGVTQWHGYTEFQSPHKGIDFGVTNMNIYAIGDGVIESKLWDTYGKKCNSGGNVMRIKLDNGMHSVYMHLQADYDGEITNLKVGDKVTKGQLIGRTGNSGEYNCQPLSHHLHFELRKNRSQSSHIDPVPYINTDWDNIKTINAKNIPGRLTGDNPHPGY